MLFGGNVCSPLLLLVLDVLHAYLNSCHRYQQCTKLLHVVTSCKCQLGLCHVMSPYIMSRHVLLSLAHPGFLRSSRLPMDSSETEDSSSESDCQCAKDGKVHSWDARPSMAINRYVVSLRPEQEVCRSERGHLAILQRWREEFLADYEFPEVEVESIIDTLEAHHLRRWCVEVSWSFCPKCGKLSPVKLVPSFRTRKPNALDLSCKCGGSTYSVLQAEDVPLILRNLTAQDIRVLRPLDIHSGEYKRVVHG